LQQLLLQAGSQVVLLWLLGVLLVLHAFVLLQLYS
jgi:hypothetical protein